jgi:predicted nucleotidyltransferase
MIKTREDALRLVREFRDRIAALYGDRLKGVYLYGSFARDEAGEDSDIDIAVILEGPVSDWEEGGRTVDAYAELSLRETCILMPFFLSEEEYRTTPYAVHRSIVREGIPA